MKNQITIREALTEEDAAAFWEQLRIYFMREISLTRRMRTGNTFSAIPNTVRTYRKFMTASRIADVTCFFIGMGRISVLPCR